MNQAEFNEAANAWLKSPEYQREISARKRKLLTPETEKEKRISAMCDRMFKRA